MSMYRLSLSLTPVVCLSCANANALFSPQCALIAEMSGQPVPSVSVQVSTSSFAVHLTSDLFMHTSHPLARQLTLTPDTTGVKHLRLHSFPPKIIFGDCVTPHMADPGFLNGCAI